MHFGDVFDLPRLRQSLHMPLIEWRELKDIEAGRKQPLEPLGCWSLWQAYDQINQKPRPNMITGELQLALGRCFFISHVINHGLLTTVQICLTRLSSSR